MAYLVKVGFFKPRMLDETAVMSLAGFFRAVRFGADEAHGVNNLMYYNFLKEQGVYSFDSASEIFTVDVKKFLHAVTELARQVLLIEATGDYDAAVKFKATYGKMPAEAQTVLKKLEDIPVDVRPIYVSAEKLKKRK